MHPPYTVEKARARALALDGADKAAIRAELMNECGLTLYVADTIARHAWDFANPAATSTPRHRRRHFPTTTTIED